MCRGLLVTRYYDRLQKLLVEAGFDRFAEEICQPYYAPCMGAPSLPPGRYFQMHMIGYFEGTDSERGIVWRCSDSLSLREFLRLSSRDKVPNHIWLSKTRSRLPHEVTKIFGWVLAPVAQHDLVKAERVGVDGSTMEANPALRTIVRRDTGESYREMLTRSAALRRFAMRCAGSTGTPRSASCHRRRPRELRCRRVPPGAAAPRGCRVGALRDRDQHRGRAGGFATRRKSADP